VAAPTQFKLELASDYGVDETVRITRDPADTFATLRDLAPMGFDVAVDVTGASGVVQLLPDLTAVDGTIFVYGMCDADAKVSWSPYDIFRRQLTVKGSFAQVNCLDRALTLLRSGRVRTAGLITHRFALDDYGKALTALSADQSCLKAVVTPSP
jgi:D-arabinitol dehydrogenase (NADP+)